MARPSQAELLNRIRRVKLIALWSEIALLLMFHHSDASSAVFRCSPVDCLDGIAAGQIPDS